MPNNPLPTTPAELRAEQQRLLGLADDLMSKTTVIGEFLNWETSGKVEEAVYEIRAYAAACGQMAELLEQRDHYKDACIAQAREIEQVLGRALGYPENQTLPEIGGQPGDTTVQTFNHTAEDLAVLAAELLERDRWIPVDERLPEKRVGVIVWAADHTQRLDWLCGGTWAHHYPLGAPTHWRPLPQPPAPAPAGEGGAE